MGFNLIPNKFNFYMKKEYKKPTMRVRHVSPVVMIPVSGPPHPPGPHHPPGPPGPPPGPPGPPGPHHPFSDDGESVDE